MIRPLLLSCALLGLGACAGPEERTTAYVAPAAPHTAGVTRSAWAPAPPTCCELGGGRAALLTRSGGVAQKAPAAKR